MKIRKCHNHKAQSRRDEEQIMNKQMSYNETINTQRRNAADELPWNGQ